MISAARWPGRAGGGFFSVDIAHIFIRGGGEEETGLTWQPGLLPLPAHAWRIQHGDVKVSTPEHACRAVGRGRQRADDGCFAADSAPATHHALSLAPLHPPGTNEGDDLSASGQGDRWNHRIRDWSDHLIRRLLVDVVGPATMLRDADHHQVG